MHRFIVPAALLLLAQILSADAKDLKILTGAGMSMPVRALAAEFGSQTGNNVTVVSDTAGGVRIGGAVGTKAGVGHNGTGVAQAVAGGEAQYGVTLISEMLPNKGVTVWPLPDDMQMTTIYAAALSINAENAMDARALLNELRGPKGRDASIKAGLKPVAN